MLDVQDSETELWASTVSFWELAIKQNLGKFDAAMRFDEMEKTHRIRELTIHSKYTEGVRNCRCLHGDPFDRMLVAQAMVEGMTLVTADDVLRGYGWLVCRGLNLVP